MKPGLITLIALVLVLGLGLLAWNLRSGNQHATPQPEIAGAQPSSASRIASSAGTALAKPAAPESPKAGLATKPADGRTSAAAPPVPYVDTASVGLGAADIAHAAIDDHGYGKKYASYSEAERKSAFEAIRRTLDEPRVEEDKAIQMQLSELKAELGWLQDHLTP